jgi:hypothetical protein
VVCPALLALKIEVDALIAAPALISLKLYFLSKLKLMQRLNGYVNELKLSK